MRRRSIPFLLCLACASHLASGCALSGPGTLSTLPSEAAPERLVVNAPSLPWTTTNRYPEWFRTTYRYKELVGWVSNWQSVAGEWKGIPHRDIRMGILQLDAGAIYPFHAHPAPEQYYVTRGTAEWTVGDTTFIATSGTAIHTPPNTRHQMLNKGSEPLELVFVWWAPSGDHAVLDSASKMLEGWDRPATKRP